MMGMVFAATQRPLHCLRRARLLKRPCAAGGNHPPCRRLCSKGSRPTFWPESKEQGCMFTAVYPAELPCP